MRIDGKLFDDTLLWKPFIRLQDDIRQILFFLVSSVVPCHLSSHTIAPLQLPSTWNISDDVDVVVLVVIVTRYYPHHSQRQLQLSSDQSDKASLGSLVCSASECVAICVMWSGTALIALWCPKHCQFAVYQPTGHQAIHLTHSSGSRPLTSLLSRPGHTNHCVALEFPALIIQKHIISQSSVSASLLLLISKLISIFKFSIED